MPNEQGFTYTAHPARVLFGAGRLAELPDELQRLGWQRVMLLSTPGQHASAQRLAPLIGPRLALHHAGAVMHVPAPVVAQAVQLARQHAVDGLLCFGGGSTIGLAKAMALDTRLPIAAIPTTYAGSEMTPVYGITTDGLKRTGQDPVVLPRVVLYDPELTLQLPPDISATSGLNAMAHAAEGLYARDANPVTTLMAEEALRALAGALPAIARQPHDAAARSQALYGAWLCGTVLGNVGMALHHKLCHTLGGSFNLPHAPTHSVVLAHALAYNAPAVPEAMRRLARALGADDAEAADPLAGPRRVHALLGTLGVPASLRELGLAEAALDRCADTALANPYWNPRPLQRDGVRALLQRAWAGSAPQG